MTDWVAGTGLASVRDATASLASLDPVAFGLHTGIAALELDAFRKNKVETLAKWGVGFILEHLDPLPRWLDELSGAPDQVRAQAAALRTAGATVTASAREQAAFVARGDHQQGLTAQACRDHGATVHGATLALGETFTGLAGQMQSLVGVVEGVRGFIVDLITDILIGLAKKGGLGGPIAAGASIAFEVSQAALKARAMLRRLQDFLTALTGRLRTLVSGLTTLLRTLDDQLARPRVPAPRHAASPRTGARTLSSSLAEVVEMPGFGFVMTAAAGEVTE